MRFLARSCAMWSGMTFALLYVLFSKQHENQSSPHFQRLLHNGTIVPLKSPSPTRFKSKSVIFITTSEYSTVENALLTKLAQALYPVRSIVLWIVVPLPMEFADVTGADEDQDISDDEAFSKETLRQNYLKSMDVRLARFGIPYVLLDDYQMQDSDWNWAGHTWKISNNRNVRGLQRGLLWAVRNVPRGVVMLGDEHFTYNSALFREVQYTEIASTWPVGFAPYAAAFTAPVAVRDEDETNDQLKVVGYYNGKIIIFESIRLEVGAFAVDLEYLRNTVPYQEYWKLATNGVFTNKDFQIPLKSIHVLGRGGCEIFVWRTSTTIFPWPNSIGVTRKMNNSNIDCLLRNALGPIYSVMKDLVIRKELKVYTEYKLETDLKDFT